MKNGLDCLNVASDHTCIFCNECPRRLTHRIINTRVGQNEVNSSRQLLGAMDNAASTVVNEIASYFLEVLHMMAKENRDFAGGRHPADCGRRS